MRSIMRNRSTILLSLFLSSLTLKLLIFFLITDPNVFGKYPFFAERLAHGDEIGERILDLSPLYLTVNRIFFQVYGKNWEGLAILQIILGSLNVLSIFFIGEKMFNKTAGIIAAVLLLFYGNMTLFELTLEPEAWAIFLNSLLILSLLWAGGETSREFRSWRFLVSGILLGLSVCTKPNALLFLPLGGIWIWRKEFDIVSKLKASLLFIFGLALVLSPVTLRNYSQFHDLILVTADGGKVFYHGNGPGSTGMERADLPHQGFKEEGMGEPDSAHALFRQAARAISGTTLRPSECSSFWFHRTLDYVGSNPSSALFMEIKKFFYFWGNYEVHEIDTNYKYSVLLRRLPLVPFGIISILGIVGMFLARKKFRQLFLLYSMVGIYLLSVLIFFAASRYRLPAVPFLALFAGYTLTLLLSLWKERRRVSFGAILAVSFLLFLSVNLPFQKEVEALERWQTATRIHYSLGGNLLFKAREYREAVGEYRKALTLAPDFAPAYNRLGMTHAILNELEDAEKCFRKVIDLAPEMDQGYLNLAMLYKLNGRPEKAIPLLEKAISLNPKNVRAKEHLEELRSRHSR